jgi:hypothetical protein
MKFRILKRLIFLGALASLLYVPVPANRANANAGGCNFNCEMNYYFASGRCGNAPTCDPNDQLNYFSCQAAASRVAQCQEDATMAYNECNRHCADDSDPIFP